MGISRDFYILTVQLQYDDDVLNFGRLVEWVDDNHPDDEWELDAEGQFTLPFFSDDPCSYCQRLSARFPGLELVLSKEFVTIATYVNGGELRRKAG